jgi:hypothetical protein
MADEDDDVTADVANERESRDLVFTLGLRCAKRAVEFVEEHEEVEYVAIDDRQDSAGFTWHVSAAYGRGHSFVRVRGAVKHGDGGPKAYTLEALVQVMGNEQAGFDSNVPRAWVELAVQAAEARPG